jgi:PAS domain S-box-containing protein
MAPPPSNVVRLSSVPSLSWDDCRLLVDSVADYAIFMLDTEGRVATWNVGAEKIKGYKAEEIVGHHFSKFFPPEDVAVGQPERELAAARDLGRFEDENWRVRKDGSRFWANVVITALRDEKGTLRGFGKVTRDLTARRAAEEQSRRAEERFHLLVDAVTDYAIFMLDTEGRVTTWNSGATRVKGYLPEEIIGKHFSAFYTPQDQAEGKPARILETVRREGRYEDLGWRVRKDGSRFWANVVITALQDRNGTLHGFAKVTRDLTERRNAEEERIRQLRESVAREAAHASMKDSELRYRALSRRLEVILDGIGEGVTVQDRTGKLVFANTQGAHLCGISSARELLETPVTEIIARFEIFDEAGMAVQPDTFPGRRVLRGETPHPTIMRVREKSTGREWWNRVTATAVLGEDGLPELAVNIMHDVTGERLQRARDKYLADATGALSSSLITEEMLGNLAGVLAPGIADWCSIYLLEGEHLAHVATAHRDDAKSRIAREFRGKYPPTMENAAELWKVIHTGASAVFNHITDEMLVRSAPDPAVLATLRQVGMRAAIIAPIQVRERVVGILVLVSAEQNRQYKSADVTLAEEVGRRAGVALENAHLYKTTESDLDAMTRLHKIGSLFLSHQQQLQPVLTEIVDAAIAICGSDFGDIQLLDSKSSHLKIVAHRGFPQWRVDYFDSVSAGTAACGTALLRAERVIVEDVEKSPIFVGTPLLEVQQKSGVRAVVSTPIVSRTGKTLGIFSTHYKRPHRPDNRTLRLLDLLAQHAGDIIERANTERALEEANRAKDEFLATVSHELRTPLSAILGWATLLKDRVTDPSIAKPIQVIHRNAEAQTKIIDDILDVSRIISGKFSLEPKPADLVAISREAIEVVRQAATAKKITLSLKSTSDVCLLVADPERLQQVLWNLLSNAVKFTGDGGKIRVEVKQDGSALTVTVTDTGKGIEPDFLPYVFDRFKQADSTTTRRTGGLGLGLALVRHIVELHGGHVTAASEGLGKGATFAITLPVRAVIPATSRTGDSSPPPAAPPFDSFDSVALNGVRVLVVDDEPDARELIGTVLNGSGAEVQTASSAAEGFELFRRLRPHVLVSDIGMPDEDGYSFIRRIRALAPGEGGQVPALALTAFAREGDRTKALSAGYTTHIGKPVNPEALASAVANLAVLARP